MKVCRSIQQSAVSSNNSQTERAYSTSIINTAKNLNRIALPIIAVAAFASVLSVASFNYNSCVATCNASALAEIRYDTCMTICKEKMNLAAAQCWELCSSYHFSGMEMSFQGGRIHLKRVDP